MPRRHAFGKAELAAITELFAYYEEQGRDFGYQDHYEKVYTQDFVRWQGFDHAYADAVCTGTVAVFVALAALQLPKGSEVIVSPITDPGTITALIYNQLVPVLADALPDSYNISPASIASRITERTKALLIVHAAGQAAAMGEIMKLARDRGIRVVEDCSQAHGARHHGQLVGTFGDIAAFSTMYRKAHGTGGCGGVVYTRNQDLYNLALAHSDRGKPKWLQDFQEKDPSTFLFPALNLNQDEISCAIGIQTLGKLRDVIKARGAFVKSLAQKVSAGTRFCRVYPMTGDDSPFFLPIFLDVDQITCSKTEFAQAVEAEGIVLNPDYRYLVADWPWAHPYLSGSKECPNARSCRDRSFNILFNEEYGDREAADIAAAIAKVEQHYKK
jgi:dTDP-4-amino-4,6-dideoxygalactose transaminase